MRHISWLGAPPSKAVDNGGDRNCHFLGFAYICSLFKWTESHNLTMTTIWASMWNSFTPWYFYYREPCTQFLHNSIAAAVQFCVIATFWSAKLYCCKILINFSYLCLICPINRNMWQTLITAHILNEHIVVQHMVWKSRYYFGAHKYGKLEERNCTLV